MSLPIIGKGTTIAYAPITGTPTAPDGTGGTIGTYVPVGKVLKIVPPATKVGKAEVTTFGDTSDQFLSTYLSTGDVEFDILYITGVTAVIAPLMGNGLIYSFQITLPDTHTWTCTGFWSDYSPEVEMKKGVTDKIKLTISGKAIYA
jgi:hypothetical protein